MPPIEGKIAKILDDSNLVINVGRGQGVKEGMLFVIYTSGGEEVKDPDTGRSLGVLEVVKGYVSAVHVQDNLSLCTSAILRKGAEEGGAGVQTLSGAMMAESLGYRASAGEYRLSVNPSQVSGMARVGPVSVGDKVRSIDWRSEKP